MKFTNVDYPLFIDLYKSAQEYDDADLYIAERGWQDWMDNFDAKNISLILKTIYRLEKSSITELRGFLKMSRVEFSRKYKIPLRTIENWELNVSAAPDYVLSLISYTVFVCGASL